MTRAERDALIAQAKRIAIPVHSCVTASIGPDHLIGGKTAKELAALVLVLAEAADPVKLRAVVNARDDQPDIPDRDLMLYAAHEHALWLRRGGLPVPARVRAMDSEYRENRRQKGSVAEAETAA